MDKIFAEPNLIFICGKPKSGKSYLIKYLIQSALKNKKIGIKFGICFCLSKFDRFDKSNYSYLPEQYVYPGYSDAILKGYLNKLEKYANKTKEPIPNNLRIFDNIIGSLKNSDMLKQFVSMYRKYNTWVFIATQYAPAISTIARETISFAFIFKQRSANALEAVYDAIGLSMKKQDFMNLLFDVTKEKHSCLMYVADAENDDEEFMSYKAPPNVTNYKFEY